MWRMAHGKVIHQALFAKLEQNVAMSQTVVLPVMVPTYSCMHVYISACTSSPPQQLSQSE